MGSKDNETGRKKPHKNSEGIEVQAFHDSLIVRLFNMWENDVNHFIQLQWQAAREDKESFPSSSQGHVTRRGLWAYKALSRLPVALSLLLACISTCEHWTSPWCHVYFLVLCHLAKMVSYPFSIISQTSFLKWLWLWYFIPARKSNVCTHEWYQWLQERPPFSPQWKSSHLWFKSLI